MIAHRFRFPLLFGAAMTAALMAAPASAQAVKTKVQEPAKTKVEAKAKTARAKEEAKATTPADPVDLNSASDGELQELPGIGPAHARKIIDGRPHKSVDAISTLGLPADTVAKLKPLVVARPLPSPVDINKDTAERLETLPGIGTATAKAIMAGRPYKDYADLEKVKGLGTAKVDALRGRLKFSSGEVAKATETVKEKAVAKEKMTPKKADAEEAKAKTAAKAKVEADEAKAAAAPKETAKGKEMAKEKAKAKVARAPGQKININTASLDELQELTGIGPVHGQAIIDGRPYEKIEDVMKVKGIKEGIFGKIKDDITVK